MKKIIFAMLITGFFFVLNASDVFACSCSLETGNKSIKEKVKEAHKDSTAVFVGEVIDIIQKPDVYSVEVKFKIEKSWDNKSLKEVTIFTGRGGGDCGYKFEVGKKYLVYAYGNKELATNICTRTSPAESNEDIAFLNKTKKSKIKSSPK